MKKFDYALSILLIILAAGHGFVGTLAARPWNETYTMWAFSGSVAAWLIAAVNILRVGRPGDRPLSYVALFGALSWIGLMFWLAYTADMIRDIRIWLFVANAAGLVFFSARSLRRNSLQ